MSIGYALFFAAIAAYITVLVISFWINNLGGHVSFPGLALIFVISAILIFVFLLLAPANLRLIATLIGAGIVLITLIIHLLSQA